MNATTLAIQPNIFYTPEEVAALLRVPMQSVQELLENGVARSVRIGTDYRVLGQDLLRLPEADATNDSRLNEALLRASEPSFATVWENDEDAIYDTL